MKAEQREHIIALALKMFISDGVKAVTMSNIAKTAGVSKRTLYEEFEHKEELLFLAAESYFNMRNESLSQIVLRSANVLVGTMAIVEDIVGDSEINWRLHRGLKASYPMVESRFRDREEEGVQRFVKQLSQGVSQGLISPRANLELSIVMLHHMAASLVHQDDMKLPKGVTTQDAFRELFINFLRGIATARGVEIIDDYILNR
ncbi:MAG: TetR/AcrR family transcriptional regulator [Rikenellaceae bacterium]